MFCLPTSAFMARRIVPLVQQRAAAAATSSVVQIRSLASSPPQPSPTAFDPAVVAKTPEEKAKNYITYDESKYKLGKMRSNAYELVSKVPIIEVEKEMAICDGGGGALGHPVEYISLERPGSVGVCKYCALRFTQKKKE